MIKKNILVTVKCTVYNHEPYLRQCLDGFVMQKPILPLKYWCMMMLLQMDRKQLLKNMLNVIQI